MAKGDRKAEDPAAEIPHERPDPRPDFTTPLAKSKLPASLQRIIDSDGDFLDALYDGNTGESTESNLRYAAYANRIRTILVSAQRYVAYTSDVGESFRPVAHPNLVRAAYGISWAYLIGDVSYEGYKAYLRNQKVLHPSQLPRTHATPTGTGSVADTAPNTALGKVKDAAASLVPSAEPPLAMPGHVPAIEDYRAVMAERAVFQSIASMGLPAFTIHSIVRYSGRALKNAKNLRIRMYGPIGLGLAAVPALPFIFDRPIETAVGWVFHRGFELMGGPEAVRHTPTTGQKEFRRANREKQIKEKEL